VRKFRDGDAVTLVEQIRRMRIAEVELVVEVHASRHHVFRKRISGLESQSVVEASLPLHEQ
jgi:hypothetical protein